MVFSNRGMLRSSTLCRAASCRSEKPARSSCFGRSLSSTRTAQLFVVHVEACFVVDDQFIKVCAFKPFIEA